MNLKRGWRLHSPTEKRQAEADRSFSHLSQIADFSPECSVVHTFPISSEKAHKSAHRLQQVDLLWMVTFGNGNIESYGCNQIIVLIVHIVTLFLKEAKSFSLINATQILYPQKKIDQASLVTLAVIIILGLFVFKNSTILDQKDCIPELKIYECYF